MPVQPNLPGKLLSTFKTYRIVNECPPKPSIGTFFPRAPQPKDTSQEEMEDFSPVFSTITNVIYYNSFVAACLKQSDATLIPWVRLAVCSVDGEQSYDQIQTQLLAGECDIIFTPPPGYDLSDHRCYNVDISECNVTGNWNFYDKAVEGACNTLNFPYIQPSLLKNTPPLIYANVFCYLCNNRRGVEAHTLCKKSAPGLWIDDAVTMAIILSYRDERDTSIDISVPPADGSRCAQGQIFDHVKVCIHLFDYNTEFYNSNIELFLILFLNSYMW